MYYDNPVMTWDRVVKNSLMAGEAGFEQFENNEVIPAEEPTHLDRGVPALPSDLRPRDIVHHHQDGPCPTAQSGWSGRGANELLQLLAVLGGESERVRLSAHGTGRGHEQ